MFCSELTVYVNEIDTSLFLQLTTRLLLLENDDTKNITYSPVLGNEHSTLLPSGQFDKVLIRNSYHHFTQPDKMIKDCRRILKKGGKLYIVDILKDETPKMPQCQFHLTRKAFLKGIEDNGFRLIKETPLDYDHFRCFEFELR